MTHARRKLVTSGAALTLKTRQLVVAQRTWPGRDALDLRRDRRLLLPRERQSRRTAIALSPETVARSREERREVLLERCRGRNVERREGQRVRLEQLDVASDAVCERIREDGHGDA